MRKLFGWILPALTIGVAPAAADGDATRGGQVYRACVACHSLEPGVHLTGPSLAGLWGRRAGTVEDFMRYSRGLRTADVVWDADTLNAWLADPDAMVPGTYMVFRGLPDDAMRADLIALLEVAMMPGGGTAAIERGLVTADYVRGQQPDALSSPPDNAVVVAVRHCGDSYFVATADGEETPLWEMNVRLKIDSRSTGPQSGRPVVLGAGMMGDRVSIVFADVADLARFIEEKC